MKQITKFKADDGTEFDDRDACAEYEQNAMRIQRIMARLPVTDIRGEGFVQLDRDAVLGVQRDLVLMFEGMYPGMKDQHTEYARNATVPAGMTLIGRYIDDCSIGPLRQAWGRLMRIDKQFREYEQPYFAIQADKRGSVNG